MIIRKLEQNEHGKTRELWEQVFPEDTKEFLDYYYFVKARDNQIYVIEEEGEIRSMLQLNPYEIRIENRVFPSFYIIAVATQKEYRGRGYMGALLRECMQEMYSKKVPFTFLMPAAEAIYLPYDFRYIYNQAVGKIEKDETAEKQKNTVIWVLAIIGAVAAVAAIAYAVYRFFTPDYLEDFEDDFDDDFDDYFDEDDQV